MFSVQIAVFKVGEFALDQGKVREFFSIQCVATQSKSMKSNNWVTSEPNNICSYEL